MGSLILQVYQCGPHVKLNLVSKLLMLLMLCPLACSETVNEYEEAVCLCHVSHKNLSDPFCYTECAAFTGNPVNETILFF